MYKARLTKLAFWAGMTLTALCGIVARFWDLNRQSLWQDEIHTAVYVLDRPLLWEVVHRVATWDLHSPLYYVLLRMEVWAHDLLRVPLTDGNLRILSAVLGVLALGAVWGLFRNLLQHRGWAFLAFFLAAFNMYGIYYSQELRMYAAILVLAPSVLYFQLQLWETPDHGLHKPYAAGYAVGSLLLLYSSLIGLFFVAGTGMALLVMAWLERKQHPKRWQQVLGMGLIIGIGYAPWFGVMWGQSMNLKSGVGTGLVITQPRELLKFAMENLWFHAWKIGSGFELAGKIARVVMPLALLNLFDAQQRKKHGLILLGFALTFIFYFIVTYHKPFHTGRYFSAWWPWALYFLAAGFSGLQVGLRKFLPRWVWAGMALAAAFGGLYIWVQVQQVRYYFSAFEKENYRAAVQVLNQHPEETRVLTLNAWQRKCFTYYGAKCSFLSIDEFNQAATANPLLKVIYVGVQAPQTDPAVVGLSREFTQQAWEIKSLNYYTWPQTRK
jgi:hypothetical protein